MWSKKLRYSLNRIAVCEDLFHWILKYNKVTGMNIALHLWKDRQLDQFSSDQKQTQMCINNLFMIKVALQSSRIGRTFK